VSCDAGHLYDNTGERFNQWSHRMERFFDKRALCFRKQYGLKNQFLLVSSSDRFIAIHFSFTHIRRKQTPTRINRIMICLCKIYISEIIGPT
jgi:hypothetical protein